MSNTSRAFTLIEMAIVVVIIGLILAVTLPLLTDRVAQQKVFEGRGEVSSLKQEIIGFALANGILPNLDDVEAMGGSIDTWGNPVAYWSDPEVTSGTGSPICELPNVDQLSLTDSEAGQTYDNVAFVIASRGPNVNLQVGDSGGATYPTTVTTYGQGDSQDTDHTTSTGSGRFQDEYDISGVRAEPFDDIVEYVSFGFLYDRLGCGPEDLEPQNAAISFTANIEDFQEGARNSAENAIFGGAAVDVDVVNERIDLGNNQEGASGCIWWDGENATLCDNVGSPGLCANATWTVMRSVFRFAVLYEDADGDSEDRQGGFTYTMMTSMLNQDPTQAPCGDTGFASLFDDRYLGYAGGTEPIDPPKFAAEFDMHATLNRNDPVDAISGLDHAENHVAGIFWGTTRDTDNIHGLSNNPAFAADNPTQQIAGGFISNSTFYDNATENFLEDAESHWARVELHRTATTGDPVAFNIHIWLTDNATASFLDVGANFPVGFTNATYYDNATVDADAGEMNNFRFGWTVANGGFGSGAANTFSISKFGMNLGN